MERLSRLEQRLASLRELQNVITAMRSLAAVRVQEARTVLAGERAYAAVVDSALASALPLLGEDGEPAPPAGGETVVLLFGSEHGFVGAFNDRLLDAAAALVPSGRPGLLAVGTRAALTADERDLVPLWREPQATRAAGITE
ncbi:MAG TPA: F0F1 ATP synthase subunit gamma, partial [Alphaproteobacteria bacterium]|nr:F0F1 ATP synthase subunit gamma [Alphaproteobacteria bacterium]